MNNNEVRMSRRNAIKSIGVTVAATAIGGARAEDAAQAATKLKGHINHSVCQWCYGKIAKEDLAKKCVELGIKGIDLLGPADFPLLKKYGLVGTMTPTSSIGKGLNRKENHAECLDAIRKSVEATAAEGWPNVICFSGNRAGMADDEGLKNCAEAIKQVVGLCEEKKVTLCMELLNSKVNHKDYMCDHTEWGAQLCKAVGSPRFKLLYDIYHMQIMEGDIIATIRKNIEYIGHVHTGGVPGRNEIDEKQELNYPAIMQALVDLKYTGYVAQEFVPKRDPLTSLTESIKICDV